MGNAKIEPILQSIRQRFESQVKVLSDNLNSDLKDLHEQDFGEEAFGIGHILEITKRFAECYSQVDLLNNLLQESEAFVPRSALFILKDNQVHGWAARGFSDRFTNQDIKKVHWPVAKYPELRRAVEECDPFTINFSDLGDISEAIKSFDGYVPFMSCFYPVSVRNKVAAVLYADSGSESSLGQPEMLEFLAYIAGVELTLITTRLKKPIRKAGKPKPQPSPTAKEATPAPAAAQPAAAPAPKPEPVAKPAAPQRDQPPVTAPEPEPAHSGPSVPTPQASVPRDRVEEKCKRVARVLVSDIKLYHEAEVARCQREGNMYAVLKEDIDRSFQHYSEKVKGQIPEGVNYFKDELIRQLTDGRPELLGNLPF